MFSLTPPTRVASICMTSHAARLQQLLEHDAVLHVLAGRDAHRGDAPRDGGVAEDVVGAGRLLDPREARTRRARSPTRSASATSQRWFASMAIGKSGPTASRAMPSRRTVVVEVGPDLELDLREAVGDGLAAEPRELLVGVAEPAGRRRVGGVPGLEEPRGALDAAGLGGAEDRERLVGREGVAEVAEVDERHELLGAEPGEAAATAAARRAWPCRSHSALTTAPIAMCMTPFSGPSQRSCESCTSRRDAAPMSARSASTSWPTQVAAERLEGGDLDVVAAPDREDEAVALEAVARRRCGPRRRPPSSRGRGSSRPTRRAGARSGSGCPWCQH